MLSQLPRRIAAALAAVACAFSTADNALGQCQYEVTAIIQGPPCPPAGIPAALIGTGMNSHGHVTGYFHDCHVSGHHHGFFWTPRTGRVNMHKPPDVWRVWPRDINDNGLIVGFLDIAGVGQRGFVYDMHTQEYIALLEPLHGVGGSSLNAINNSGVAVGSRSIGKPGQNPNPSNAVIWNTHTGEVIDLGVGEGPNSALNGISESGEYVVGWANGTGPLFGQAAIWTNGKLEVIGPLPGTDYSVLNAVNENGVAVGSTRILSPSAFRAFTWDGSATMIEPVNDWTTSRGEAINDLGQAGIYFSHLSQGHVALLWQHGELHYLNSLLDPSQPQIGLQVVTATNNNGQVLCAATGNFAVVLSPADRPLTDLNADCRTDVHDLLILLDAWGRVPRSANIPADFNGDGVVDVSDLLILLANWTMP